MEIRISLEGIEAVSFFGVQNKNINFLGTFFPKVRIVARGNEIILIGNRDDIAEVEKVLIKLIDY